MRNLGETVAVIVLAVKDRAYIVGCDADTAMVAPHRLRIAGRSDLCFCNFHKMQTSLFQSEAHLCSRVGQKWSV